MYGANCGTQLLDKATFWHFRGVKSESLPAIDNTEYERVAQSLCSSNCAALILMNVHSLVTCGLDPVRRILFSLNVTHNDRAWPAKNREPQSF